MPPKSKSNYVLEGKRCPRCNRVKPPSDYGKIEFTKNWARCKECNSATRKAMRANDTHKSRVCITCKQDKDGDQFYDGSNICVDCHNVRGREWNQANLDKVLAKRYRRLALLTGRYSGSQIQQLHDFYTPNCRCKNCGKEEITTDHVIPLVAGGPDELGNIQFLCGTCNRKKGMQTIDYRVDGGEFARSIMS